MNAADYQEQAARTQIDQPDFDIPRHEMMAVWNALGFAGKAGDVAELIKKGVFHRRRIDPVELEREIGDVLWYVSALCTNLGLDLDEIMQANLQKLKVRYPDAYSVEENLQPVEAIQK